jgi:thioredoxin-related protein
MKLTNYLRQFGLSLILACSMGAPFAQTPSAPLLYADDLAATADIAGNTRMPIMLIFTKPGCPFCMRAKKDHLEPLNADPAYANRIMLREIEASNEQIPLRGFDGTMTTHGEFARRYDVRTVPTVILVDGRGMALTDPLVGLNEADFYNLYLQQAIDAARLRLRTAPR